jgi:hypothetical protein
MAAKDGNLGRKEGRKKGRKDSNQGRKEGTKKRSRHTGRNLQEEKVVIIDEDARGRKEERKEGRKEGRHKGIKAYRKERGAINAL